MGRGAASATRGDARQRRGGGVRGARACFLDRRLLLGWYLDQQSIYEHAVQRDLGNGLHELDGLGDEEVLAIQAEEAPEIHRSIRHCLRDAVPAHGALAVPEVAVSCDLAGSVVHTRRVHGRPGVLVLNQPGALHGEEDLLKEILIFLLKS